MPANSLCLLLHWHCRLGSKFLVEGLSKMSISVSSFGGIFFICKDLSSSLDFQILTCKNQRGYKNHINFFPYYSYRGYALTSVCRRRRQGQNRKSLKYWGQHLGLVESLQFWIEWGGLKLRHSLAFLAPFWLPAWLPPCYQAAPNPYFSVP